MADSPLISLDQVDQQAQDEVVKTMAKSTYNLYEAKTALSQLVEEAAAGAEIVIAKAGKPMAKLVPIRKSLMERLREVGPNPMGVTYIAPDFDEPAWTDEELDEFGF